MLTWSLFYSSSLFISQLVVTENPLLSHRFFILAFRLFGKTLKFRKRSDTFFRANTVLDCMGQVVDLNAAQTAA